MLRHIRRHSPAVLDEERTSVVRPEDVEDRLGDLGPTEVHHVEVDIELIEGTREHGYGHGASPDVIQLGLHDRLDLEVGERLS